MTTTSYNKLNQYVQFKTKYEMDENITKFRQNFGYKLTKSDNRILDHMKTHSCRYPGVFYQKVETVAKKTGKSIATVKRAFSKFIDLGLIKRYQQIREKSGGKGATVYQFQFFKTKNEPSKMSHRDQEKTIHEASNIKASEKNEKTKPFISLKQKSLFNKTYQQAENVVVNKSLEDSLTKDTPYHQMRKMVEGLFNNKKIVYRLYGVWLSQSKKSLIDIPFDIALVAVKKLIEEIKRRISLELKPLNNPVGYFNGILNNLISRKADQDIQEMREMDWFKYQQPDPLSTLGKKVEVVPDWFRRGEHKKSKSEQPDINNDIELQKQISEARKKIAELHQN